MLRRGSFSRPWLYLYIVRGPCVTASQRTQNNKPQSWQNDALHCAEREHFSAVFTCYRKILISHLWSRERLYTPLQCGQLSTVKQTNVLKTSIFNFLRCFDVMIKKKKKTGIYSKGLNFMFMSKSLLYELNLHFSTSTMTGCLIHIKHPNRESKIWHNMPESLSKTPPPFS